MRRLIFTKDPLQVCGEDALLVYVPTDLITKSDLLKWFAIGLQFPDYYDQNWDALVECLQDLSWIKEKKIIKNEWKLQR